MLPAEAGTTIFKKYDAKSELKHEKHQKAILQTAFLIQIQIKIRRGQFFFTSLGNR